MAEDLPPPTASTPRDAFQLRAPIKYRDDIMKAIKPFTDKRQLAIETSTEDPDGGEQGWFFLIGYNFQETRHNYVIDAIESALCYVDLEFRGTARLQFDHKACIVDLYAIHTLKD